MTNHQIWNLDPANAISWRQAWQQDFMALAMNVLKDKALFRASAGADINASALENARREGFSECLHLIGSLANLNSKPESNHLEPFKYKREQ